jgi:hypothetical protein
MKLVQITLVAVLSAAFLGPAFAGGSNESQAEMEALQGEAVQAGPPAQHVAYWNTMKPERKAAWQSHCALSASDVGVAQKDTAERAAFCKSIQGAK